jgi:hypothetical protein
MLQYYCLRCCSTYFLNIALHIFSMLQYIIFDVALHSFACCSIYVSMLQNTVHIFLRYCTLKCFVLLGQRSGGERGALGNGDRGAVGNRGQGHDENNSISFYFDPILQGQTGLGRRVASRRSLRARRPDVMITEFTDPVPVARPAGLKPISTLVRIQVETSNI